MPTGVPGFGNMEWWQIYKSEIGGSFQNLQASSWLDLNCGGGQKPAVHGYARSKGHANQLWHGLTVGQKGTVVLMNKATNRIITVPGPKQPVNCEVATEALMKDDGSKWFIKWERVNDQLQAVRFVNFKHNCVLDLANGDGKNGTAVYAWPQHQGQNQLWKFEREP